MDSFWKIEKVQQWTFFGHFFTNLGYVSQLPYNFDLIAQIGPYYVVEWM